MKKALLLVFLLSLCLFPACTTSSESDTLSSVEDPFEKAVPEGYEAQYRTDVYDTTYINGNGETMVYYVCRTTYFAAVPDTVTGLHTQAFCTIFDLESTPVQKEFDISGHPAAVYLAEGRSYLCCTVSPEVTLVLEYNPASISEDEAIRTIRSAFENPQQ